jgi:hypothetical protein
MGQGKIWKTIGFMSNCIDRHCWQRLLRWIRRLLSRTDTIGRRFVTLAANDIQLKMLTNSLREHNVKRVVDLGSGDGVVCIHLAKELGIKTAGYELNPWLVVFSRTWAWYSGVGNLCSFHQRDLFKADVSKDDGVVLFVVPSMMDALEEKLKNELKDDAKVYALRFPLNTWKEEHYESGPPTGGYNVNQLWVYPSRQRQMSGVQSPAPLKQSSGTK